MDEVRSSPIVFDTLKLAQGLRDEAKFAPEQAEKMAVVLSKTFADWQERLQLVTKTDLKAELLATESRLERMILASKIETLKWICGIIGFQTLVILGTLVELLRNVIKL